MNKLKNILLSSLVVLGVSAVAIPTLAAVDVSANTSSSKILEGAKQADPDDGAGASVGDTMANIVNILLYVIGAVAVLVIIIGGIMYAVSAGDPGKAKKAKDTILYAVVGLAVAMLAYAIVNFVITGLEV